MSNVNAIQIKANSQEDFQLIEQALQQVDSTGAFFNTFAVAQREPGTSGDIVILMVNRDRPRQDLNRRRFTIRIPNSLVLTNVSGESYMSQVIPANPANRQNLHRITVLAEVAASPTCRFKLVYEDFTSPNIDIEMYPVT